MNLSKSTLVTEKLKDAVRPLHDDIERLPFAKALLRGEVPLDSYLAQLRALSIIHSALERELFRSDLPVIASVWKEEMRKLPLLEKDIKHLETRSFTGSPEPTKVALELADRICLLAAQSPVSLLGCLYVFEGSTNGASILRDKVVASLALNGNDGVAYYSSYGSKVRENWMKFKESLDAAVVEPVDAEHIVEAAKETFGMMVKLNQTLYPLSKKTAVPQLTAINPEAGNHAMPEDPQEVEAALIAAVKCIHHYPYFEHRYGDRGMRFGKSDSAWLVTLSYREEAQTCAHVSWLGRVLSSRGMPQITLEAHLRFLHEALVEKVPDRFHHYRKLTVAADELQAIREGWIPPKVAAKLIESFDQSVKPVKAKGIPRAAELLVSAVADEKEGIEKAVSSIEEWMACPDRFPETWNHAVRTLIQDARKSSL